MSKAAQNGHSDGILITGETYELTTKQAVVIAALLTHPTIAAAAECVGVSPRSIHRMLADDVFTAALRLHQQQLLLDTAARLAALQEKAIDALEGILNSTHSGVQARLKAADMWCLTMPSILGSLGKPRSKTFRQERSAHWATIMRHGLVIERLTG